MSEPYQEILEGELNLRLAPGPRHELICGILQQRLEAYFAGKTAVSKLLPMRTELNYSDDAELRPDISLATIATGKVWLAAEVINSGDHSPDTVVKKGIYDQFRLPRLWMIDPRYDNVEVYACNQHGLVLDRILGIRDSLTEPLLAGFELPLRELFGLK